MVCILFSEISTGRWAVLQLRSCPNKQDELSENNLQNLFHNLTPQIVNLWRTKTIVNVAWNSHILLRPSETETPFSRWTRTYLVCSSGAKVARDHHLPDEVLALGQHSQCGQQPAVAENAWKIHEYSMKNNTSLEKATLMKRLFFPYVQFYERASGFTGSESSI